MTPEERAQFAHLMDTFEAVDLHPDLVPYVQERQIGTVLHHPLVIQIFFNERLHKLANQQYRQKIKLLEEAQQAEEWTTIVYLHERPYRLSAFMDIAERIMEVDEADYWELLADIWVDSESISMDQPLWLEALATNDPDTRAQHFMEERERDLLASLPRWVDIYRGVDVGGNEAGMSWTLDRDKAEWFARRYHGHGTLLKCACPRDRIIAVLLGRGEQEVIVDPATIGGWTTTRIGSKKSS
jgi:hypothetical protein